MKPLPLTDRDTLLIDNSRYENFTICPRRGQHAIIDRRVEEEERSALTFGNHLHAALKLRYMLCHNKAVSEKVEARQMVLLEHLWNARPTQLGDHRTLGLAQDVIARYNVQYKDEPFQLVELKGNKLVEEPFALPLGIVDGIKIVWTGVIDLPSAWSGELFVMDHKSSSIGGDYFFQDFINSSQMMGYCWVIREQYKIKVHGAVINALFVKKPPKTEKAKDPISFVRQKIYFENDRLDEWRDNTLRDIQDFLTYYKEGYYPMHTTQCIRKYGACPYFNVCNLIPQARGAYLASAVFRDDTWDPIHSSPKKLFADILSIPDSELTYTKRDPKIRATVNIEDYSSLI